MTPQQYELLRSIKEGDVIRMNKSIRVVRQVSWRKKKGRGIPKNHPYWKGHFYFTILRCSWTGRCYTVYTSIDLAYAKIEILGHNFRSKLPIDEKIREEFGNLHPPRLTCCDVHGIH